MNRRVFLASLFLLHTTSYCMEGKSDLTLADFTPLISKEEIQSAIIRTADDISQDYKGKSLTLVMIMKGAIHVTSDLMRHLKVPSTLEYVQTSSYGQNGTEPGKLTLFGLERLDIKGKDVLLIDDILDTGETLSQVTHELFKQNPASLKTLVLLKKSKGDPLNLKRYADYPIFTIGNAFVIGYGLDYKEQFRELPDIWVKKLNN